MKESKLLAKIAELEGKIKGVNIAVSFIYEELTIVQAISVTLLSYLEKIPLISPIVRNKFNKTLGIIRKKKGMMTEEEQKKQAEQAKQAEKNKKPVDKLEVVDGRKNEKTKRTN